jgi:hypothetical protein
MNEPEVPVSDYGRQRRAAWLARLQANSDMADRAALEAHGQTADHRVVQQGQAGIFGPGATGEQMAADVAARRPRVGEDWGGGGRDLQPLGGLDFESQGAGAIAPIPPRADLRFVNQVGGQPTGESPLARWLRENR